MHIPDRLPEPGTSTEVFLAAIVGELRALRQAVDRLASSRITVVDAARNQAARPPRPQAPAPKPLRPGARL